MASSILPKSKSATLRNSGSGDVFNVSSVIKPERALGAGNQSWNINDAVVSHAAKIIPTGVSNELRLVFSDEFMIVFKKL